MLRRRSPRAQSAYGLLGAGVPAAPANPNVPTHLLADLHAPDLVITPDYVGPRREGPVRRPGPASPRSGPGERDRGRSLRWYQALVVAVASVAVAVPLTLFVSHRLAEAHASPPAALRSGPSAVGSSAPGSRVPPGYDGIGHR
jgi:hypothetical protein